MKSAISLQALAALALLPSVRLALAQVTPGPSPTNSYGCVPHNDHWDCEGSITPTVAPVVTSSSAAATTPAPVVVTTTSAAAASSSGAAHDHDEEDHEEEDHDHAAGTGSLAPSPTNSIGCVPHGDHWDCDAPAPASTSVNPTRVISNSTMSSTSRAANSASATPSPSLTPTGGAATMAVGYGVLAGVLGLFGVLATL